MSEHKEGLEQYIKDANQAGYERGYQRGIIEGLRRCGIDVNPNDNKLFLPLPGMERNYDDGIKEGWNAGYKSGRSV